MKPPRFDASKKYPLILEIHGGPFGNYNVGFNYMFQNFAANGFVVLVHEPARQHRLRQRRSSTASITTIRGPTTTT